MNESVKLDRVIFGDNQFFGVNHMSEEKARSQAMKFKDTPSIMSVLDNAYTAGISTFMPTTHDRIAEIAKIISQQPEKYGNFQFYPCMPYAHKYANSVGEVGIIETLKRFSPGGVLDTMFKGASAAVSQDGVKVMKMLVDMEMQPFADVKTPVVFLQNVVTDLVLGLGMTEMLVEFHNHVRDKYGAEAGFITMNLPRLVDTLEEAGIVNPIVCANINKIGFRMSGGIDSYIETLSQRRCRAIAMSVFASGAIPPAEAIDWVCNIEGIESILFGASSKSNIEHSKKLIDSAWQIQV